MQINFASDIHLEICKKPMFQSYLKGGDVLILAGDITSYPNFIRDFKWINSLDFEHIIYICGNHEFYNGDLFQTKEEIKNIVSKYDKIHFLDNESIEINGVKFIGSTLWTDFDNNDPVTKVACERGLNDYYYIHKGTKLIKANDALKEYNESVNFLKTSLQDIDKEKTVVVTHHTPSYKSCSEFFEGDILNGGYHNSLEELILETQPKYWIHGHTHSAVDYMIGDTRVLCNALGYNDIGIKENSEFKMNFYINI